MARLARSKSLWLLLSALAVIVIVAHGWQMQAYNPPALPEAPPSRADYYLRDAVLDVMDNNGNLSYRMKTSELLRFSDHSSEMTNVEIESLGGEQGVWMLEAGQANISKDQEVMRLSGGVHMRTSGQRGNTRLTTMTLMVEIKNKRMNTADPVIIVGPDFQAQAVGMQTAFNNRNMILLNKVKTRYVP